MGEQQLSDVIKRYFAAWNERDEAKRRELIEQVYGKSGRYVDPLADAVGWEEIDANVAAVQRQFGEHCFRLASGIDTHHDGARFEWELVDGADTQVIAGVDYVQVATDGRLRQVTGFFGPVPVVSE